MSKQHHYSTTVSWTGNKGSGTSAYTAYERAHNIQANNKAVIAASSDVSFRGDKTKYNPEELLVASLSSCHMLWYLHLCAVNNVVVVAYNDNASGTMEETANGGGRFIEVVLHPEVVVTDAAMLSKANELHEQAHQLCYIANSCNFPVKHQPVCRCK